MCLLYKEVFNLPRNLSHLNEIYITKSFEIGQASLLNRGRKSNGSLSPSRAVGTNGSSERKKEYPPHIPRDYQIKNSKLFFYVLISIILGVGKKLEDMKMTTFKEILNSFEANDYRAFQMLMKQDKDYFQNAKKNMAQ